MSYSGSDFSRTLGKELPQRRPTHPQNSLSRGGGLAKRPQSAALGRRLLNPVEISDLTREGSPLPTSPRPPRECRPRSRVYPCSHPESPFTGSGSFSPMFSGPEFPRRFRSHFVPLWGPPGGPRTLLGQPWGAFWPKRLSARIVFRRLFRDAVFGSLVGLLFVAFRTLRH